MLVIGAGLLGRSLMKVLEVNPGFRVDKIVAMDVSLPSIDDPKAKSAQGIFFSNLIDRLNQIPGVRSVGAASALPMTGGLPDGMFLLMTQNEVPKTHGRVRCVVQGQKERIGNADFCVATAGYFHVLGIPLVRGRMFDERDCRQRAARGPDQRVAGARPLAWTRTRSDIPLNLEIWMATCAC